MKKLILRMATGLGLFTLLSISTAHADFISIPQPNAAYQGATILLNFGAPDFDVVSSLTNGTQTATFDIGLVALTVPSTWGTWGSPPNTESATPRVLWTDGFTTLTIDLALPVLTFGFEAEPNVLGLSDITASFFSSGSLIGSITQSIDGNAGGRLFAATTSTDPFDRIELSSPTDDFAIANVRYAVTTQAVPEPASAILCLLGGGLALLRYRRLPR